MTTTAKRIPDVQARAITERAIEYGLRRGLLDALRLSYEQARDGSLIVYTPRHRGYWRIQPPGVGEQSVIRIIALGDDGRVQLASINIPVRWDELLTDWAVVGQGDGEIAADVWKAMALLAREAGWLERTAA